MTAPGAHPGAYPEASQATSALIWSIVSLVCCCAPVAIVGFVQSRGELSAIAAGRRDPVNQGTASAARIIAIIVGVLWILGIVAVLTLVLSGATVEFSNEILDQLRGFDNNGF